MKSKAVASFVIASLLGSSVAAFAQQPGAHHRAPAYGAGHPPPPAAPVGRAIRPAGAIPHRDWHRGDRLPPEYRDRNYVVNDWRAHRLSSPPRGYHWVGVNGDYVLVAVATGLIANILISGAR